MALVSLSPDCSELGSLPLNFPELALLETALAARRGLLTPDYSGALRLFNGFYEGWPDIVVDLYGRTLVLFNYADQPAAQEPTLLAAMAYYRRALPGLHCGVLKTRAATDPSDRRGRLIFGSQPADRINEDGIWYALDLLLNQDASFYLDTRLLRRWLRANLAGKTVLNTFAYTGSLGTAAWAGGAARVVQTDLKERFLNLARRSCQLNGFTAGPRDFVSNDFFRQMGALRNTGTRFDCVILDPPFFSVTSAGRVDLLNESTRLINKLRPLIAHQGWLVTINNAVFLSGLDYINALQALCTDGYLTLETLIPVPPDVTGFPETICAVAPVSPAPFNHPTKIAILRVTRKIAPQQE